MTKVVPTETNDPLNATSDAAQGGAYADAISEAKKNRVEQLTQEERGSIGSTASLPAVENILLIPEEEKGITGSTARLTGEENIPLPLDRFLNPSGSDAAATTAAEVEEVASNAPDVSSTVPEPAANKDEGGAGSLLNPGTTSTTSSECLEGQQQQHYISTSTVNEKPKKNEPGGITRVSPVPNVSEMGKGKHRCDGDGNGDSTTNRTFSLPHPNEDTASLANADNNPISLASREREESKNDSRASSLSNYTPDTEEYDEEEEFEPAGGGGAVFARRGTRRYVPRPSSDRGNDKLASEKRPSFRAPPVMSMGHPVGSLSAEFLERHERRVKEATIRRESVSELLKLVMNHDPVSSGSPMPDVDVVFPDYRSDQNEGDWFV